MVGAERRIPIRRVECSERLVVKLAQMPHPLQLSVISLNHNSVVGLMAVGTDVADGLLVHVVLSNKTLVSPSTEGLTGIVFVNSVVTLAV
jgi:hypothetical protein